MAPIVFYHFAISAPSRAVLLTFRSLNLEVDIKVLNLFEKEQLNNDFIKINPQHTVPTIDDNGFYLWESRVISAYLVDEKSPGNSLYPIDTKKRAIVNQRLSFDLGVLYQRIRNIGFPVLFLGETTIPDEKRKQLFEAFEFLEKFLEANKWIAGDAMTIADLAILASISTIVHAGADLSTYPKLAAWYENMKSVPGWSENAEGAKLWGEKVKSKLTQGF